MTPRLLLALSVFAGMAGCNHKADPEPIVLGHVAPLTGPDKARGEQARQGIALAVEEANAEASRVLDRRVTVDHADTRSDPAAVRAVVMRLLSVNRVAGILGGPETAAADNLGSAAQSGGVPFILSAAPQQQPALDFVFFTGLTPAARGRALGKFAQEEFKAGPLAVVSDGKHDALLAAVTQELPKDRVAGTWTYAAADKLGALAKEAAAKKPAAVLFAGSVAELQEWLKAGPVAQLPVLFAGDDASLGLLRAASVAPAVYLVTAFAADDPAAKEFVRKYEEHYSAKPDAVAALAYDDARMLFDALRRAKSVEGVKVRKELSELRFDGLTGPVVFDKQHGVTRTAYVVKLSGGKEELRKTYPPEEKQ